MVRSALQPHSVKFDLLILAWVGAQYREYLVDGSQRSAARVAGPRLGENLSQGRGISSGVFERQRDVGHRFVHWRENSRPLIVRIGAHLWGDIRWQARHDRRR